MKMKYTFSTTSQITDTAASIVMDARMAVTAMHNASNTRNITVPRIHSIKYLDFTKYTPISNGILKHVFMTATTIAIIINILAANNESDLSCEMRYSKNCRDNTDVTTPKASVNHPIIFVPFRYVRTQH